MSDSLRPHGLYPTRLLRPWDFPGKHTGVGCHFLLQRIFLTRGSNPGFLHCRQMLYRLSHREAPKHSLRSVQFSSVQLFSRVRLFATPWIAARQASLSITNSRSSLQLMCIESVMPSSHLILCRPLLLLAPIPPSIRIFSNESTLRMRWPRSYIIWPSLNTSPTDILSHPSAVSPLPCPFSNTSVISWPSRWTLTISPALNILPPDTHIVWSQVRWLAESHLTVPFKTIVLFCLPSLCPLACFIFIPNISII